MQRLRAGFCAGHLDMNVPLSKANGMTGPFILLIAIQVSRRWMLSRCWLYHCRASTIDRNHILFCIDVRFLPLLRHGCKSESGSRFLAFGVGLDPQQKKLFGMFIGPLAVGCSVGLTSFASAGLVQGYTGAAMHPGTCFAFAISRGNFKGTFKKIDTRPYCVCTSD